MISSFYYISYLVIQRTWARVLLVTESKMWFPDLATHLPKVVLAGGCWPNWPTKATEHCSPSKNSITKVPEGSLRFENVSWHFIINPKGPSASWKFFCMTRSIYSVLYKYEALPPQITINLIYFDICHVLKPRVPPLNSNVRLRHYLDITYWLTL
jgi:hypothetical protein